MKLNFQTFLCIVFFVLRKKMEGMYFLFITQYNFKWKDDGELHHLYESCKFIFSFNRVMVDSCFNEKPLTMWNGWGFLASWGLLFFFLVFFSEENWKIFNARNWEECVLYYLRALDLAWILEYCFYGNYNNYGVMEILLYQQLSRLRI